MKIKNGELFKAYPNLRGLSIQLGKAKVSVKTTFQLAKLINTLTTTYNDIETARVGLIQSYGVEREDKSISCLPGDENWDTFAKEFDELMAIETELEFKRVILPDVEIELDPSSIISLLTFVDIN